MSHRKQSFLCHTESKVFYVTQKAHIFVTQKAQKAQKFIA